MIANTLQLLLANIFDKFKAQSPLLAGVIIFVLGMVNYGAAYGLQTGLFTITAGSIMAKVIYVVTLTWGLMQGSRTSNLLSINKSVSTETQAIPVVLNPSTEVTEAPVIAEPKQVPETGSLQDILNKQRIGQR